MNPGQEELRKLSDEAAAHVLRMEGTRSGTRTGWLMITTIFIAIPPPELETPDTGGRSCPDVVPLLVRLERDDHLFYGRAIPV
jgi:hypothetical protein